MLIVYKHLTCATLDTVRLWVLSDSHFSESRSISFTESEVTIKLYILERAGFNYNAYCIKIKFYQPEIK